MWSLPAGSYQATASPPPRERISRAPGGPVPAYREAPNGAGSSSGGPSGGRPPPLEGLPEPPDALPEIAQMTLPELQSLSGDPSKFDHYISSHSHSKRVDSVVSGVRRDVEILEEEKAKKDRILSTQNKTAVSEEEIEELNCKLGEVRAQVEALQKEREDWVSRNTEYHLEQRLRALIDETERESDVLLQEWNSEVLQYQEFMPKYLAVRTKLAERKLKLDTFQEKLLQARLSADASQARESEEYVKSSGLERERSSEAFLQHAPIPYFALLTLTSECCLQLREADRSSPE